MLYNMPFLCLCAKILADPVVQGSETRSLYADLAHFAKTMVRHFGRLAASNPVLYADAIFPQPALQRVEFCLQANRHYVDSALYDAASPTTKSLTSATASVGSSGEAKPAKAVAQTVTRRSRGTTNANALKAASGVAGLEDESDDIMSDEGDVAEDAEVDFSVDIGVGADGVEEERWGEEFDVDAEVRAAPKGAIKEAAKGAAKKRKAANRGSQKMAKRGPVWSTEVSLMLSSSSLESSFEIEAIFLDHRLIFTCDFVHLDMSRFDRECYRFSRLIFTFSVD
jgi:hypothetical protein